MAPDETAALICSKLEERGYRGAVLPIEHVAQLKHEIEERLSQKEIDAGLYERYLTYFKFDVTASLPGASFNHNNCCPTTSAQGHLPLQWADLFGHNPSYLLC